MAIILLYTTHPDEACARRIGQSLLADKLIACANYFPMNSEYRWLGQLASEQEWVAVYKTTKQLAEQASKHIESLHPYEIPCILQLTVTANEAYEQWIYAATDSPAD
jgi:periplasmic divalent cation tolerance protein